MVLSLVTAPTAEPIGLAETKSFCRVDTSADDNVIAGLIVAARRHFDGKDAWFGRALVTQTWDLILDAFPCKPDRPYSDEYGIVVPMPPLQSVTSIKYIDGAGVEQTVSALNYVVDIKSEPGRITPAYGLSWPSTRPVSNAVIVRFVAGYGAAAAVPEDIKTWLKQAVAFLYRSREGGGASLPESFFWSMANYKVSWGF